MPHQRAQTGISTKTGVRGLAFSKDCRLAAATASVGQALPVIMIGLSRALGGSMCVIIFLVEVLLIEKGRIRQIRAKCMEIREQHACYEFSSW